MTLSLANIYQPYLISIANIFSNQVIDNVQLEASSEEFDHEIEIFKEWFLRDLIHDLEVLLEEKARLLRVMYPANRGTKNE